MDWLKVILGKDKYNELEKNGTLALLKEKFGNTEYIANDPTKVIPKHVFNEKNEENKLLKTQLDEAQSKIEALSKVKGDASEMKVQLAEQAEEFNKKIKQMQENFDTKNEISTKRQLMQNILIAEGCQLPDLILDRINYDEVIVKDDKVLNSDKIILPMKESYKVVFEKKITGKTPQGGNDPEPPKNLTRDELIKKHQKLQEAGDFTGMIKLRRQIQELKE